MKQWKSPGMLWDEGEVPHCHYCGAVAKMSGRPDESVYLHETPVSGIVVCEKYECLSNFVMNECPAIEYLDE